MSRVVPPIDYLQNASRASLESFELSRLNHAANLKREIAALIDKWLEETAEAMVARWILEKGPSFTHPTLSAAELLHTLLDPSAAPLPNASEIPADIHPAPPRFAETRHRLTGTFGGKENK